MIVCVGNAVTITNPNMSVSELKELRTVTPPTIPHKAPSMHGPAAKRFKITARQGARDTIEASHASFVDTTKRRLQFGPMLPPLVSTGPVETKKTAVATVRDWTPFKVGDMLVSRVDWRSGSKSFMHLFARVESVFANGQSGHPELRLQPWEKLPVSRRSGICVVSGDDGIGYANDGVYVRMRPGAKEHEFRFMFPVALDGVGVWKSARVRFRLYTHGRSIVEDYIQKESD